MKKMRKEFDLDTKINANEYGLERNPIKDRWDRHPSMNRKRDLKIRATSTGRQGGMEYGRLGSFSEIKSQNYPSTNTKLRMANLERDRSSNTNKSFTSVQPSFPPFSCQKPQLNSISLSKPSHRLAPLSSPSFDLPSLNRHSRLPGLECLGGDLKDLKGVFDVDAARNIYRRVLLEAPPIKKEPQEGGFERVELENLERLGEVAERESDEGGEEGQEEAEEVQEVKEGGIKSPEVSPALQGDDELLEKNKNLLKQLNQLYEDEEIQDNPSQKNLPPPILIKQGYKIQVLVDIIKHNNKLAEEQHNQIKPKSAEKQPVKPNIYLTNSNYKANLIWNPKTRDPESFTKLLPHQKINHFPCSHHLGRKDSLNKNLYLLAQKHPKSFDFLPMTFILPKEEPLLLADLACRQSSGYYIFKPKASSQGRGIFITDDVKGWLETRRGDTDKKYVVSRYITDPLLVLGRKFDLRIYVLISSVNPLRVWLFKEGIARFCTQKYRLEDFSNVYGQLTNYSINKGMEEEEIREGGSGIGTKCLVSDLMKYIDKANYNLIWSRIEDIVVKTIISAEAPLFKASMSYTKYRDTCFEILGFDILLDSYYNPWLIEVNTAPSFGTDSPLDYNLKSQVLTEAFNIVGLGRDTEAHKTKYMKLNPKLETLTNAAPLTKSIFPNSQGQVYRQKKQLDAKTLKKQKKECILAELREELARSNKFSLVYPCKAISMYSKYFEEERELNMIYARAINRGR